MSKTLVVKQADVSKLVKEYRGEDVKRHPEEISYAHTLITEGEWEWLEELLRPLSNQPGYSDVIYAVHKQAYIELLNEDNENTLSKLTSLVKKLHETNNTRYSSLLWLESHDLSSLSRHALFVQVAKFMYKCIYPSASWKPPPINNYSSRLVQLIARGLLYEQCEKSSAINSTTPTSETTPTWDIPDLVTWLHKALSEIAVNETPPILSVEVEAPTNVPNDPLYHTTLAPPTRELNNRLSTPPTSSAAQKLSLAKSAPSKVLSKIPTNTVTTPTKNNHAVPSRQPHTSTPKNPTVNEGRYASDGHDLGLTPIISTKALRKLSVSVEPVTTITAHSLATVTDRQAIRSVAFTSTGNHLAVGANSRSLRIFDTTSSSEVLPLPEVYNHSNYHQGSIYCLCWNKEGSLLASGSNDRNVRLLYSASYHYEPCGSVRNPTGVVRELKFIDDQRLVCVGVGGVRILSPDRLTVTYMSATDDHTHCVSAIEDNVLATGDESGRVCIWDVRQRLPAYIYHPINHTHDSVTSIDYYNGIISYSTNTGTCHTLSYTNMAAKPLHQWVPHTNECRSLRYSPNGQWILTGSYDGSVCVTNTQTLEYTPICCHDGKVIQARWHPLQPIIATSGADKQAKLWKLTL